MCIVFMLQLYLGERVEEDHALFDLLFCHKLQSLIEL